MLYASNAPNICFYTAFIKTGEDISADYDSGDAYCINSEDFSKAIYRYYKGKTERLVVKTKEDDSTVVIAETEDSNNKIKIPQYDYNISANNMMVDQVPEVLGLPETLGIELELDRNTFRDFLQHMRTFDEEAKLAFEREEENIVCHTSETNKNIVTKEFEDDSVVSYGDTKKFKTMVNSVYIADIFSNITAIDSVRIFMDDNMPVSIIRENDNYKIVGTIAPLVDET